MNSINQTINTFPTLTKIKIRQRNPVSIQQQFLEANFEIIMQLFDCLHQEIRTNRTLIDEQAKIIRKNEKDLCLYLKKLQEVTAQQNLQTGIRKDQLRGAGFIDCCSQGRINNPEVLISNQLKCKGESEIKKLRQRICEKETFNVQKQTKTEILQKVDAGEIQQKILKLQENFNSRLSVMQSQIKERVEQIELALFQKRIDEKIANFVKVGRQAKIERDDIKETVQFLQKQIVQLYQTLTQKNKQTDPDLLKATEKLKSKNNCQKMEMQTQMRTMLGTLTQNTEPQINEWKKRYNSEAEEMSEEDEEQNSLSINQSLSLQPEQQQQDLDQKLNQDQLDIDERIHQNLTELETHQSGKPLRVQFKVFIAPGEEAPLLDELKTFFIERIKGVINVFYEEEDQIEKQEAIEDEEEEKAVFGYFVVKNKIVAQQLVMFEGEILFDCDIAFFVEPVNELILDPLSKYELNYLSIEES